VTAQQLDPPAGGAISLAGSGPLRGSLNLDAAASGLLGLLLALFGWGVLVDLLGYPAGLLVPVGVSLAGYAAWLRFLATRPAVSRVGARIVIVGNLLWVVASVVLVLAGWFDPTGLGAAFVLLQAAAVAGFAALQYRGLRHADSQS
jgi:hypothetical protein